MRHGLVWFALVALLAAAAVAASAQMAPLPGSPPIAITINGQAQHFVTPPIMMNGEVLVPMRDVFEALKATVVWHGDTKAVTARNSCAVSVQIGRPNGMVGQRSVTLTVAPVLYESRTYVPLQFVHDALGAEVAYDPTARLVTIASAAPAVAAIEPTAPQQLAEAEPQLVAPAQPMIPPAPVTVHPQVPVTVQPCPVPCPVTCLPACPPPCPPPCG